MNETSFNRIKINCAALQHNYDLMQQRAGQAIPVMAMVKADGYGHGMVMAAKSFAKAGCTIFGVAELREGILLRQAGIEGEIYVTIGFSDKDVGSLFQYRLTPVLYSYEAALAVSKKATALGEKIGVHVKVDSGMSRLGILSADVPVFLDSISGLSGIRITGLMSHFAEADDPASASTLQSFTAFADACRALKSRFAGICHIANSGAVLNFPDTHCDMVRAGITLYGYHPAGPVDQGDRNGVALQTAMSFSSAILQVKSLPANTGISYGHTFRTEKQTKIAVLPVGYEDGYSRSLSNRGQVLVRGRRVPILGRICMNMSMVDVSGLADVAAGDEVMLLGRQGRENITADEIAAEMGTISYEVLCLLGNNNQRQYIE